MAAADGKSRAYDATDSFYDVLEPHTARVVEGRTLSVITKSHVRTIDIECDAKGVLTGKSYRGTGALPPYQANLVEP